MSEPRKQHYVPQVYLKSFAFGKEKKPKIYVLPKSSNRIYPANVSDSAAERDFYTIGSIEEKYICERYYATYVEPMLSTLIRAIRQRCENVLIQNNAVVLTQDEKFRLALSLVFQLLRGKQTREYVQNLYNRLLPKVADQARDRFGPLSSENEKLLQSFGDENKYFKEIAMQAIFRRESIERFVTILVQRDFVIYKLVGDYNFVTSDNPVVLMDVDSHDVRPFKNGLANSKTLIYYPLSPKLLLGAYHPDLYFGVLEKMDCCIEILDCSKEKQFIQTQNKKQREQSHYIYSQSKETLETLL